MKNTLKHNCWLKISFVLLVLVFITIKGQSQINADFSTTNLTACNSLQTTFFDQSTSAASIIGWSWEINGNNSSEQNPGALFTEPGSFTICLTVTDVNGNSDTKCKEDYVTVFPNPIADFTIDNTEGCVPVLVNFSDNSSSESGNIISWLWDVGGSAGVLSQSSPIDFSSSYEIGGSYSASLTVVDDKGCSVTTSKPNAVIASSLTKPDINIDLLPACDLPWKINFTNLNADSLIKYSWDFGNGDTYQGIQPPTINYEEIGIYNVTIFMESGDCKDTIILEELINTNSPSAFDYSPSIICPKNPVQFTDVSITDADEVYWDFGDGFKSTDMNPTHIYNTSGCFDVSLIRKVGSCVDTVTVSCITVLETPAVTYEITNQYACSLPADILLHAEAPSSGDIRWQFISDGIITDYDTNDVPIEINDFGSYLAVLTFESISGCTVFIDSIPIEIAPLDVNMPQQVISGCAPLSFTLKDSIFSNVAITSYMWSVANGEYTSTLASPSFSIPDTGKYDIQLIAENIYGCSDTIFIEDYIEVGIKPIVDFVASPLEGCVDVDLHFTDLSSEYSNSWQWSLDENIFSDAQNPISAFENPGLFGVTLIAGHNGCFDTLTVEDYITIFEPSAKFDIVYNCDDPYTINIENKSVGADSLLWTLQLSDTETILFTDSIFGSYTLTNRGEYPISLYTESFTSGCDNIEYDTIRIVDPIALYTVDTLRGCTPLSLDINNFSQDAFSYEFTSDFAAIDSIFNEEPIVTFTEGGILNGPLLIITDIHECTDSFQLFENIYVNNLEAKIDYTDVICVPDVAQFMDKSTADLSNIISWKWRVDSLEFIDTDPNTSLYIDKEGVYDLQFHVVDDWGCMDSISISQAITAVEVIPDFTYDTLGCSWAPINFISTGANGNTVTYSWDFGDGTTSDIANPSHIFAKEGIYSVCLTIMDIRGCEKVICKDNIVTISNPIAQYSADPLSASCPPLLTTFENQSANALTYIWDFGDNSGKSTTTMPSHVYTSPGKFDVSLIAASSPGCSDTLLIPEYVKVDGPQGSFKADVNLTCLPVGVTLNAQSDDFYTYVWDLGNGILDSVNGLVKTDVISYEYTQPGRFTPKLIVTDSLGCTRSFAGNPIELDYVDLNFTIEDDPICGPPLTVSLENLSVGTTDEVSYLWQILGMDSYQSTDRNPTFDILETGQYDVSLIAEYENCIDTLTFSDFIEVADIPNVVFNIQTEELCEDVDVMFVNNSTIDYGEFVSWFWDFGDGNTSTDKNPIHRYAGLESQSITLTGNTNKGCQASYTASFNVLPSTIATVEDDKTICIGDQIQISGNIENLQSDGNFYWEEDTTLSCTNCLEPFVSPLVTTSYILVGVHPNGCESRDTIKVEVIQSPGPELTLQSDDIICLGSETEINVVNFNQDYKYQWNTSILGQDCYNDCETIHVNPKESTTYYVTVFNEFGCSRDDSITIDVELSIEDFLPEKTGICFGEETTIGISGGNNPNWDVNSEISCLTCEEITINPTETTIYNVTVQSDLGCYYKDSILVTVVPLNNANAGESKEICVGESVLLTSSGLGNSLWSANIPLTVEDQDTIEVTPTQTEYFYLNKTYYECSQMDSVLVTVHKKADIEALGDTICVGETAILSVSGRADGYKWELESGNDTSDKTEVSPEYSSVYPVIATYRTCTPDTAIASVFVHPHVDYEIEENFYNLFLNDEIKILPQYNMDRNFSFDWLPNIGLNCSDCPNPIIKGITESVDYKVVVIDEDSNCKIEDDISVRFNNECTNSVFHFPNIFSPNNDGSNDGWKMFTNNPEEFISMSIFDRYGNLVFTTIEINQTWDGTYNQQNVTSGVYVYKAKLICPQDRKEYFIIGDVTVIR